MAEMENSQEHATFKSILKKNGHFKGIKRCAQINQEKMWV